MSQLSHSIHFPSRTNAPGLAIYLDKEGSIEVDDTEINITVGVLLHVIPYVGKTLEEIAAQISESSSAVDATALNRSGPMGAGFLYIDDEDDLTPDGGQVVRAMALTVQYTEETKIRVLMPYAENRHLPWYPRVDRGSVSMERNGVEYMFSVPEYQDQEWSSLFGFPYVDQVKARAEFVDGTTIKVARTPIHWTRNNLGLTINDVPVGATIVKDVDIHNGIIKLTIPVDQTDLIQVSYVYREDTLLYKAVNLNPSMEHNPGIIDQSVLLYLVPTLSSLGQGRKQTVNHIVSKTLTGAISSIPQTSEPTLIIGAFQVRPSGVLEDMTVTDTRTRGGGIKEAKYDEALARNREAYSTADAGRYDGIPFPAAAAGVLLLPRWILERFDADYIEEQVKRHLAVGGHILIDYTDTAPETVFDSGDFDIGAYL